MKLQGWQDVHACKMTPMVPNIFSQNMILSLLKKGMEEDTGLALM